MSFVRTAVTVVGGCATARRRRLLAAALFVPALLAGGLTAAATPAAAGQAAPGEQPTWRGGALATLQGLETHGEAVVREDGEELTTSAGLFEMAVDGGGTLQTYGTDVDSATQDQARYGETDWDQTSLHGNRNAGKILWILRHSYPQVNDLQALAKSSGAGKLTPETAAAGTQVAIWRYSDAGGDVEVEAVDPAAEKLADHLHRKARTLAEPRASLSLDSAGVAEKAKGRFGPLKVRTGAPSAAIAPASRSALRDVRVVGDGGRSAASVRDGGRLYLDVPSERRTGTASLTVQAATKVPVGRAFAGVGGQAGSQTQILAGSSRSTVSATADVSWDEHGVIPAVGAVKDCRESGVRLTVTNSGDRPFRFRAAGEAHTVPAKRSKKITVPVGEDQAYRIPVSAPGVRKAFTGVLDCVTRSEAARPDMSGMTTQSQPATVGGGGSGGSAQDGGDLAETGASNTPVLVGVAVGLVVVGAVAVLAVRRRGPEEAGEPGEAGQHTS
ncbi:TQXA domain-containing protein [Streptomyces sp. WMMB 714]|uniref:thioester domain-containing protein n=1 Tax=Streptomyces sp. WMMB 714 TaxID=1286822 RepID=UPI00082379A9|nr:thioester domain-containing protein [Streptomyces sp. WMMB 714]SCK20668.1 TQXA domain-containing protein [Streptomyces sp. WMMB 714]